ncbi:hypothetical protein O181_019891 [Austropuccinia psidii MF-1]|uniref:Uncharacterized protein n=1 Tax=Austropuccinia psidii MF-1 TaxID=1389203 RepID=A0A9Q3GUB5_9BASI|nr:hypothetical protein [Austropuccinia psidii MF-1]
MEEEESDENEAKYSFEYASKASEAPNPTFYNQPLVSQAEPSFLRMMEQMTHFMGQLTQKLALRESYRVQASKTLSMKKPDSFDSNQSHKFEGFIQSCQLIFHNYPENVFWDRKKVFY